LIVRVLKGHVHPGQVTVFREQAQQALSDARRCDGLVYAQIGRQAHPDGGEEVVFVSVWRDLDALYCWVGGSDLLDTPMLNNGTPDVLEHFGIQHYEAYEGADSDCEEVVESPRAVISHDAVSHDAVALDAVR
jgi:heme-degrading monooxygenase HmoA